MKISALLLLLTFACACGQKADDTFTKPMYFNQGLTVTRITFSDGTFIDTAPTGTGTATWESIFYKPLTFPPIAHTHDYNTEITNKPGAIEFKKYISGLKYLPVPRSTTTEIDSIVVPDDESGIVFDNTLGVYKVWEGVMWKILITAN